MLNKTFSKVFIVRNIYERLELNALYSEMLSSPYIGTGFSKLVKIQIYLNQINQVYVFRFLCVFYILKVHFKFISEYQMLESFRFGNTVIRMDLNILYSNTFRQKSILKK